jgi:5'-3' exonuclease
MWSPSKVIVVWEQGGASPRRKQIFSEYKANREKVKDFNGMYKNDRDQLLSDKETKAKQLKFLVKALGQLPIMQIYVPDCEGDDVVAYIAKRKLSQYNCRKIIVSSDHDFYQLLEDESIAIFNPMKKVLITATDVINEYGISPRNFCIARSIVGDTSDNIGGVDGVGLKTVAKRFPLLKETDKDHLIDSIILMAQAGAASKKAPKCYQDILNNLDIIKRNWSLMFLDLHNFSHSQVEKIDTKFDNFVPALNHLEFLKSFAAFEIPIPKDIVEFTQELRYLTIKA